MTIYHTLPETPLEGPSSVAVGVFDGVHTGHKQVVEAAKQTGLSTVVLALAGIFGSVMMTTKDQSNLSVVDQVQNLARFLRGQKIYPYRYGDEWGLE